MDKRELDNYITQSDDVPNILERVIAFDVGETTGVVIADVYGVDDFELITVMQFNYQDRFFNIKNLLNGSMPDTVIIEQFRLYAHKAQTMINNEFKPIKVIGAIESACYYYDIEMKGVFKHPKDIIHTPIIFQPASMIKGTPPVTVLSHHELKLKGLKHAKDAYKHIRIYIAKKYI